MSTKWYKCKLASALNVIQELKQSPMSPDEIPDLMPICKMQPKKTKGKPITQVRGTLSAVKLLEKVKELNRKEEEKKQHIEEASATKERLEAFLRCKWECLSNVRPCEAKELNQCSVCFNVLKYVCLKKESAVNGEKSAMLLLAQGTPTAGTILSRSQVLQFDEGKKVIVTSR